MVVQRRQGASSEPQAFECPTIEASLHPANWDAGQAANLQSGARGSNPTALLQEEPACWLVQAFLLDSPVPSFGQGSRE